MPSTAAPDSKPKKLQRISQACDLCHRRSIRCRPSAEEPQLRCQRRRHPANPDQSSPSSALPPNVLPSQRTYASSSDRQAASSRSTTTAPLHPPDPSASKLSHYTSTADGEVDLTGAYVAVREDRPQLSLGTAWRSFALASAATINEYLHLYMDIIYPMFPLFHPPTMWDRIHKQHHIMDRGFFASIVAACALAAARARDGAAGDRFHYDPSPEKSSETFFSAARDACMMDLNASTDPGFLRAYALLALTAIQYGQIKTMHIFMGHYHTMSATQSFHDEQEWPADLTLVEKEERRRLFWAMYQFDIYVSVVFDSVMKSQEVQSNVRYPSELDDEDLLAGAGINSNSQECWVRGWNFTTDLYRVLEHSVKRMRRYRRSRDDRIAVVHFIVSDGAPDAQVMESVLNLYHQLPSCFHEYGAELTGDPKHDLVGHQAAIIQVALQLVRMTLFTAAGATDLEQTCAVADEVLRVFRTISPQYLQAFSTPIVYHLGTVGQILGSVMEGPLHEAAYHQVRGLLVSLAELLAELESGLQSTAGASKGLRRQIQLIDEYMAAQRRLMPVMAGASVGSTSGDNLGQMVSRVRQVVPSNDLPLQGAMDEFQLPQDLVHDGAWPWPFGMTQETQQAPNMIYPQWPNHKPA